MKYDIEVSFIGNLSITDIEASSQEEAINKAKELVDQLRVDTPYDLEWLCGCDTVSFDQVNYIKEKGNE